jgi:predicted DNA-binding transcriptional regulator AlpA
VKAERIALMPDWPARMGEDMAALYLGVSQTAFREKVKGRSYPQPVREGGRLLWAKRQLDRYVDAQFNLAQPSPEDDSGDRTWDDFK